MSVHIFVIAVVTIFFSTSCAQPAVLTVTECYNSIPFNNPQGNVTANIGCTNGTATGGSPQQEMAFCSMSNGVLTANLTYVPTGPRTNCNTSVGYSTTNYYYLVNTGQCGPWFTETLLNGVVSSSYFQQSSNVTATCVPITNTGGVSSSTGNHGSGAITTDSIVFLFELIVFCAIVFVL